MEKIKNDLSLDLTKDMRELRKQLEAEMGTMIPIDDDTERDIDCDSKDDTDEEFEEFLRDVGLDDDDYRGAYVPRRKSYAEATAFLDEMVGMEHIRAKLDRIQRYVLWRMLMVADGGDKECYPEPNLTFLFLGDPGTGKTTLANHMGEILYSLDLIESPEVFVYRRENLVGENYGSEERATTEALEKSRCGVFFLDEAYQCFKGATDKRDPGYHILETLMAEFDKPGRCIIMAGYRAEMLELMKVNSGFRSRIPQENIIEFACPDEDRLYNLVRMRLKKMKLRMSPKASKMLRDSIHEQLRHPDRSFGNARQMRQLTDALVFAHANRVIGNYYADAQYTITSEDMTACLAEQKRDLQPTRNAIGFE